VVTLARVERADKEGSDSSDYPTPETVDGRMFPDEFTGADNWCVWRKIDGNKRPVRADDLSKPMKWSDESNWISHREARGLVATADVELSFFIRDVPVDTKRPVFFRFR